MESARDTDSTSTAATEGSARAEKAVIVIGPPLDRLGGMTSVVSQMLGLDFSGWYRLHFLPITVAADSREPWASRIRRHVRQLGMLRGTIARTGASIAHIHTCSGFSFFRSTVDMLTAQSLGCRVILHIHGAAFDEFYALEPAWRQRLIAWSLSRAHRVVALSAGWRERLNEIAPEAHVVVIENAVGLSSVRRSPRRGGPCRFVLLAKMDTWKGIDDLLSACEELHTKKVAMELVLAGPPGTAGDKTGLNEKIRARNLADVVRYVGPVEGGEKADLLAGADAYVQPSHHEGMPIAILEALSCGLPVVATRVGAVPEVIEDGCEGLLVPAHRPDQLARAMGDLACDVGRRERMSQAARTLAKKRFSLDRFRNDLIALYGAECSTGALSSSESRTSEPLAVLM